MFKYLLVYKCYTDVYKNRRDGFILGKTRLKCNGYKARRRQCVCYYNGLVSVFISILLLFYFCKNIIRHYFLPHFNRSGTKFIFIAVL